MIKLPGLRAPLNWGHFQVARARLSTSLRRRRTVAPQPQALFQPQAPASHRQRVDYAYMGGNLALARTHRGHKILVDTRDMAISPHVVLDGIWERHVEDAVCRLLKAGDTAVEVGANIGYHTLAMAERIYPAGKLYAFEANPELANLVEKTVFMNGYADRVEVFNCAVTNRGGPVSFDFMPHLNGGGHISVGDPHPDATRIVVPGATLDEKLAYVAAIDMLRIDAEGAEPLIISGAQALIGRSPSLVIVMEWSVSMMSPRMDVRQFIGMLDQNGFRPWLIEPSSHFTAIDARVLLKLPHSDVVFCRQPL
jgi:FkbM family methyltransferase